MGLFWHGYLSVYDLLAKEVDPDNPGRYQGTINTGYANKRELLVEIMVFTPKATRPIVPSFPL